ncbi:type I 3-dehydroquinate dehydratase [Pseudoramibacter faecis]|uniref:type I 3-dehydroquinate dehydratase n=1 Tax=Pseudoramibacter faecis TaxID=3108534 RepID=UPI002E782806|nr:type I 3-dehydroquinate dehydratase [Pseudoramibacter sp. HA2172]
MNKKPTIRAHAFALCVPIAPTDSQSFRTQIARARNAHPDFIEWRRDAWPAITPGEQADCLAAFQADGLIFTHRAEAEGGAHPAPLGARLKAIDAAVQSDACAYIDLEAATPPDVLADVRTALGHRHTGLILSHHDFHATPDSKCLRQKLAQMAEQGPDVIKIAVTARSPKDVTRAAGIVAAFSETAAQPVIFVMMGAVGTIVRVAPECFGGSLTFAALSTAEATAPGQLSPAALIALRRQLQL